jgi:hypothetical protein
MEVSLHPFEGGGYFPRISNWQISKPLNMIFMNQCMLSEKHRVGDDDYPMVMFLFLNVIFNQF